MLYSVSVCKILNVGSKNLFHPQVKHITLRSFRETGPTGWGEAGGGERLGVGQGRQDEREKEEEKERERKRE